MGQERTESMTFAEAAEAVLAEGRRPMKAGDLWAEIERRQLVRSAGKTPAATLYTELLRKSPNWRSDDDNENAPLFYRRDGLFGRWSDLSPDEQKTFASNDTKQSPLLEWRELHEKVKDDPGWRERIASLAKERAQSSAQIAEQVSKYVKGELSLEQLRADFDRRSRSDWRSLAFSGTSFAMILNQLAKVAVGHPSFEAQLKNALPAPTDPAQARATLEALLKGLTQLREGPDKKIGPHPNRVPKLFSALWHVQADRLWPTYYKSARDALDETGVVTPTDDAQESYLSFAAAFNRLAEELGASGLELEQLCKLQQTSKEEEEEDAPAGPNTWLFQGRPETFDIRRAIADVRELAWTVKQHRKDVHVGDVVYIWESGANAAILARATVMTEPTEMEEDPAQVSYYRDGTKGSVQHRVRLRIDRRIQPELTRRQILAAPELAEVTVFRQAQGTNFELRPEIVEAIEALLERRASAPDRQYWKIAPGPNAEAWPTMLQEGVVALSWHEIRVGDLRNCLNKAELERRIFAAAPEKTERMRAAIADQLWMFRGEMNIGDVVVANEGFSKVVGEGEVTGDYFYRPDQQFPHARPVRWIHSELREVEDQGPRWRPTVVSLTPAQYDALFDEDERETEATGEKPKVERPVGGDARPYGMSDALKEVFLSRDDLTQLKALLDYKKNLVLAGPPGVGKTFVARELAYLLLGSMDESRVKRVQFHQSYAYEDFVRGYRPATGGGFEYRDGPFLEFCEKAQRDSRPHVLIIDEINRGNLSKILGELMLLIESDKRDARWSVDLAYAKKGEAPFWVPPNLHIIGTMNTADRSLALVDYALRRRFVFWDVRPAFELGGFEEFLQRQGVAPTLRAKIRERIAKLNRGIEEDARNLGPGFSIGHSYFCQADPSGLYDDAWYSRVVRFEIEPLLREYWAEDLERARDHAKELLRP